MSSKLGDAPQLNINTNHNLCTLNSAYVFDQPMESQCSDCKISTFNANHKQIAMVIC